MATYEAVDRRHACVMDYVQKIHLPRFCRHWVLPTHGDLVHLFNHLHKCAQDAYIYIALSLFGVGVLQCDSAVHNCFSSSAGILCGKRH